MIKRLALLSLVGLAAACSKSDAENFADTYCGEVAKCCAKMGSSGSGQFCRMAFTSGGYNASAGQTCLAEVHAEVAAGTFCDNGGTSPACDNVVATGSSNGKKQPGDTCEFDSDCAPSSEGEVLCASLYDGSTWIHKCQLRIRASLDATPCLGTQDGTMFSGIGSSISGDLPARGYVCYTADGLECASGKCTALGTVGQTCSYSSDCVRSAFCDGTSHCASRLASGATCTGSDDSECVDGYYCPTTSPRQCTTKLPKGASCTSSSQCASDNCDGTTCGASFTDQLGWGLLCA